MNASRGKLVVISGPSGAGKTSVCRALKQHPDVEFSVSATTRVQRDGERDGIDYHFLSRDDFQRRLGENQFLEWATYNGNLYGTPRWPMDQALARGKTFLVEIEVKGTRQLRERGIEGLYVFIAPPSIGTLGRGSIDPPPVRAIEPGGGEIVEPVQDTRLLIHTTMRRNTVKFQYCYQQALMKNPKLEGRMTLKLDVDAQGRVTNAKATGDLGDDVPVCMEKVAKSLVFPALPEGPTSVTYPFHFQSVE